MSENKHEPQHSESPTWCIHCGDFDPDPNDDCDGERTGSFDSRIPQNRARMISETFGLEDSHE